MSFFCKACQTPTTNDTGNLSSSIRKKRQPLKLWLLGSLGLLQPLIYQYVLNKERSKYEFPRRHLRFLERDGCSIPILYFPLTSPERSTVIVYSHGNGSDLNHVYDVARKLFEMYGVAVVAYDYTGYGESRLDRGSFEQDIKTVLAWVLAKGYSVGRIVLAGFSLGSYPTLLLDASLPRLLIAPISGITSFVEGEVAHYEQEPFDNIRAASRTTSRVFMVHSTDDIVSIEHSRLLYEALTEGRSLEQQARVQFIQTAGLRHNQTPNFLTREHNRQFGRFLMAVKKDAETACSGNLCDRTKLLVEQLALLSQSTTIYEDTTK